MKDHLSAQAVLETKTTRTDEERKMGVKFVSHKEN